MGFDGTGRWQKRGRPLSANSNGCGKRRPKAVATPLALVTLVPKRVFASDKRHPSSPCDQLRRPDSAWIPVHSIWYSIGSGLLLQQVLARLCTRHDYPMLRCQRLRREYVMRPCVANSERRRISHKRRQGHETHAYKSLWYCMFECQAGSNTSLY
jgi:hypothetical protein